MELKNLPGPLKAAILIQSLDRDMAEEIMESLAEPERRLLKERLAQLGDIASDVREKVAREFLERLTGKPASLPGPTAAPLARVAAPSETPEAVEAEGSASPGPEDVASGPGFQLLRSEAPEELARLIRNEHPQTIAIILSHLPTDRAGEVLTYLPDEVKGNVASRIAMAQRFSPEMLEEINQVFMDILKKKTASARQPGKDDGLHRLAEMLNFMEKDESDSILTEIETEDPVLAARIRQMMFVFDDVILVDDRGLQQVLRKVDTRELAIALKAASEEIRRKIFQNMSERAGDMLREEMETLGPVRMRDVENAQQVIINIIQEMEADGSLVVQRGTGSGFVS